MIKALSAHGAYRQKEFCMRNIFLLFVIVISFFLCACGPKVHTVPYSQTPVITPDENTAVVYVIREWKHVGSAVSHPIYEDGKQIGVIANGSYCMHKTTPGKHFYHVDVAAGGSYVEAQAGQSYYLVSSFVDMGYGLQKLTIPVVLKEIPEVLAQPLLPELQYATPAE